jgi:hypothetical protein
MGVTASIYKFLCGHIYRPLVDQEEYWWITLNRSLLSTLTEMMTFPTFIQEGSGSNLGWNTDYPAIFLNFCRHGDQVKDDKTGRHMP